MCVRVAGWAGRVDGVDGVGCWWRWRSAGWGGFISMSGDTSSATVRTCFPQVFWVRLCKTRTTRLSRCCLRKRDNLAWVVMGCYSTNCSSPCRHSVPVENNAQKAVPDPFIIAVCIHVVALLRVTTNNSLSKLKYL